MTLRKHIMPFKASDITCVSEDGIPCACFGRSAYWEPICHRFIETAGNYAGPFRLKEKPNKIYFRCQECLDSEDKSSTTLPLHGEGFRAEVPR